MWTSNFKEDFHRIERHKTAVVSLKIKKKHIQSLTLRSYSHITYGTHIKEKRTIGQTQRIPPKI